MKLGIGLGLTQLPPYPGGPPVVLQPPTVTSLEPATGLTTGGTSVEIIGTIFVDVVSVQFGSTPATDVVVVSETSITATSPAMAEGTEIVTVTTLGGTSAEQVEFTYEPVLQPPTVTSVVPATGLATGGTAVTITGTFFVDVEGVSFGLTPATDVVVVSETSITATSPAMDVGDQVVTVTTAGGQSAEQVEFTYTPLPDPDFVVSATSIQVAGLGVSDHYGFPGLTKAANNDLILAYRSATTNGYEGAAKLVCHTSTDAGKSWGAVRDLVDPGGTTDPRDVTLRTLANGTIIATYYTQLSASPSFKQAYVVKSADNGVTWGTPIAITSTLMAGATSNGITGAVLELANGDLIAPLFGVKSGGTLRSMVFSKSTDAGATWADLSEIDGDTAGVDAQEGNLTLLASGTVFCGLRSPNGTAGFIKYATSSDSGATWSSITATAHESWGRANVVATTGGALLWMSRTGAQGSGTGNNFVRTSWDDGVTWGAQTNLPTAAANPYRGAYGQMVELSDGFVGVVHAMEYAVVTQSNVYFTAVYDPNTTDDELTLAEVVTVATLVADGSDQTASLQSQMAALPDGTANLKQVLELPAGAYRVDGTINWYFRNHITIRGPAGSGTAFNVSPIGATLKWATDSAAKLARFDPTRFTMYTDKTGLQTGDVTGNGTSTRQHWFIRGCQNCRLENIDLNGPNDRRRTNTNRGDDFYAAYEADKFAEHGIGISLTAGNVTIDNVNINEVFGDAYYVGDTNFAQSTDIEFLNCTGTLNGRQGIGITNVNGLLIEDCDVRYSGRSGLDIEPNHDNHQVRNATIRRTKMGPYSIPFIVGGNDGNPDEDVSDTLIEDCEAVYSSGGTTSVLVKSLQNNVTIRRHTDSRHVGTACIRISQVSGEAIVEDCTVTSGANSPTSFGIMGRSNTANFTITGNTFLGTNEGADELYGDDLGFQLTTGTITTCGNTWNSPANTTDDPCP